MKLMFVVSCLVAVAVAEAEGPYGMGMQGKKTGDGLGDVELTSAVFTMLRRFEMAFERKSVLMMRSILAEKFEFMTTEDTYKGDGAMVPAKVFQFDKVRKIRDVDGEAIINDCCPMMGMMKGCRRCIHVMAPMIVTYENDMKILNRHEVMMVKNADNEWKAAKSIWIPLRMIQF